MPNSLNPSAMDVCGSSQEDISLRLAALNRWQDEQKRLLQERQQSQRQMLGLEQRNMYKMLGLLNQDPDTQMGDEDQPLSEKEEHMEMPCVANTEEGQPNQKAKPKCSFLKRGEGLKQRFKISPDQLRLDNLPRYKFANAHPQFRRTMPLAKKSSLKKPAAAPPEVLVPAPLDLQEQQFQQLLLNSKNVCQSTPDLKSITSSSASQSTTSSSKVRFAEQTADDELTQSSAPSALVGVKWSEVLDTQNIKPMPLVQRRTAQIRVEDDSNVSIFELLEQKAREGNFDMNSSCIRTFMARKDWRQREDMNDETDQIIVTQQMRQLRLEPKVTEIFEDEDENEEDLDRPPQQEEEQEDSTLTTPQGTKTQVRVRFSDSNDTHSYSNESTLTDNVQLFEQFKSALFQALEKNKKTPPSQDQDDLQCKANLVRQNLDQLEKEIATFKKQNEQLLHLKQQHELIQAKCQQDHQEAMDRVHDEKIQAEIYLHDERMKIEEERRKFEQQMRMQKSTAHSQNKKEISSLKQEIEQLQLQLKQKEQQHVSAQARLRAQLRASEREQKSYREEIELLSRENKRLEQELIKIGRENNSKMLQEINRNIARLAPKVLPTTNITQALDENGRRTKSLDGIPPKVSNKSNTKLKATSRRRSWSRSKNKPALDESCASSNSDDLNGDEEVMPQAAPPVDGTAPTTSAAVSNSSPSSVSKREIVNQDGSKDIWYPNGNLKKISADGMTVRMLYFNKDIKETDIRKGTVKYYYNETNTWHTTYLDGLEILEFPNGQTEHRHKNGSIEIHFPNNSIKLVDPNDTDKLEEWRYADGTRLVQLRSGDKILNLPNGQKEIHTKLNKRREYPDGTVKLVYPDGSQETRYSNGRVRLKDKDGKLIMDTDFAKY